MQRNTKQNQGITLIALIITIIVMIILVAVTVNIAANGGIFKYTKRAADETNAAIEQEDKILWGEFAGKTIQEYITVEKPVTNPYKEKEWKSAWAVVDDQWTSKITKKEDLPANARIIAKMYETVEEKGGDGCNAAYTISTYQMVVEGQGDMPQYIPVNENDLATAPWDEFKLLEALAGGGLNEVYICDGITSISNQAFYSYGAIQKVEISNTVSNIGEYAFYQCALLKNIVLANNIISIGDGAFQKSGLESIIIHNNIQSIGTAAFYESKLTSVFFLTSDASKITIGQNLFKKINEGSTIYILETTQGLEEKLEGTYDPTKTTISKVSKAEMEELIAASQADD